MEKMQYYNVVKSAPEDKLWYYGKCKGCNRRFYSDSLRRAWVGLPTVEFHTCPECLIGLLETNERYMYTTDDDYNQQPTVADLDANLETPDGYW